MTVFLSWRYYAAIKRKRMKSFIDTELRRCLSFIFKWKSNCRKVVIVQFQVWQEKNSTYHLRTCKCMGESSGKAPTKLLGEVSTRERNVVRRRVTGSLCLFTSYNMYSILFFFLSFLRWAWLLLFLQFKTQQGFYQYSAVNILCNSPYTLNSTEMIENHLLRGLQNNMGYHERSIYFEKFLEDRNQWIEESYYKGDISNPNNDLPRIKFNRGPSIILRAPEKLHLKKLYYRVQLLKKLKRRPLACEFKLERNPM